MTWFPFRRQAAWNSAGASVATGSGAVYAVTDTLFATPLVARPIGGGSPLSTINISSYLSETFEVEDQVEVHWKSGALPEVHLISAKGMADATAASAAAAETSRIAAETAAAAAYGPTDTTVATLVNTGDSESRVALDGLSGVVNALKSGATGDGVTDDGPALAAALTSAAALGFHLFLPPGTYLTAQKLAIPTGMTVTGVPGKTIVKAAAGSTASPLLFDIASVADVTVTGVTFDGNQSGVTNFNNVCVIYSSTRVRLDRCKWQNTRGIGAMFSTDVSFSGVSRSHFNEVGSYNKVTSVLTDRRQAVAFSSGTKANNRGNYVTESTFTEVGLDCVSMSSQAEGLIFGNTVYGNNAGALYVSGSSQVKVVGNHVQGYGSTVISGNGVDVFTSTEVTIADNTVSLRGAAGVMVADSTNVTITGNVCTNNWQSSVVGYPSSTSAHEGGITVSGQSSVCSNVTITGNVCTDTQGTKTQNYGVHISNHAHTKIWVDDSNLLTGNLTADIGGGGAFAPYSRTPTYTNFTPGDATVTVRYVLSRGRVTEVGSITLGSTSALAGSAMFISLPATPSSSPTNGQLGTFTAFDASTGTYKTGVVVRSGSNGLLVFHDSARVTSSSPWTWVATDLITWNLSYVPA